MLPAGPPHFHVLLTIKSDTHVRDRLSLQPIHQGGRRQFRGSASAGTIADHSADKKTRTAISSPGYELHHLSPNTASTNLLTPRDHHSTPVFHMEQVRFVLIQQHWRLPAMDIIHLLLVAVIVLAVASLLWWGISQLTLPPNVKVVIQVVLGVILLLWILSLVTGGGGGFGHRVFP